MGLAGQGHGVCILFSVIGKPAVGLVTGPIGSDKHLEEAFIVALCTIAKIWRLN